MGTKKLYEIFRASGGVSIDTRTLREGEVFFALRGISFDGNAFAQQALDKGAKLVVTDNETFKHKEGYFWTENTLHMLQFLANYHRKQFHFPFIALTGSNGKTTTKELIAAVLQKKYRVISTRGNLNNHIGVPLTLLSIQEEDEIAVIEMGANHRGEIKDLCRIAEPTHGLITNIGKAHLEGFGGIEGVKKGKGEMYDFLEMFGKTAFINSQDSVLMKMAEERNLTHKIFYPAEGDFLHCELAETGSELVAYRRESGKVIETQTTGLHNFYNICVALCIGKYFGVEDNAADEAVRAYVPENNRSQILQKGSNTIILDAYNANPTSVAAALESLSRTRGNHKVVILGDMFELGEESKREHRTTVELADNLGLEHVLLCGPEFYAFKEEYPKFRFFNDAQALKNYLREQKIEHSTVLIKGSRGMRMEETVEFI